MALQQEWLPKPKPQVSAEIEAAFPNEWVQRRLAELDLARISDAQAFLNPSLYRPSHPLELPDLEKGALRIQQAIKNGEAIGVWGDFDVDGQSATTLLVQMLRLLGASPRYHIPNRGKESHGIRVPYLQDFIRTPVSLLITCDTGVSEHDAVTFANQHGMDVVITDHHSLPPTLPDAYAVINPQRLPDDHPLHALAGVGTAYKLAEYLLELFGREGEAAQFLDLVALGTIADVARLDHDNRWLVQRGLEKLRNPERLLIQEILLRKEIDPANLDETHISFTIAPLLNALGRLDDANPIVEHFLTGSRQEARVYANLLDQLNEKRKLISAQITEGAVSFLERDPAAQQQAAIVLHHPDWHAGVLGIVANRLVELYHKPAILLTGDPADGLRGSGRSVEGINLIEAIRECRAHLQHFGGHTMAAGLSLQFEHLEAFKRAFHQAVARQMGGLDTVGHLLIEDFLEFDRITLALVDELAVLAPFGPGNPPLQFASKNVNIKRSSIFGKNKQHIRFSTLDEHETPLEFLWWQGAGNEIPDSSVDIVYRLGKSIYKGQEQLQIEIVAMRPAEAMLQELETASHSLEIIDMRSAVLNQQEISSQYTDLLIWGEGLLGEANPQIKNRSQLYPAKTLLIMTAPPSLIEIAKAWKTVNPQTLILAGNAPQSDSLNVLIQTVSGMVKTAVSTRMGSFDIQRAAAACGQRTRTVRTTLDYLAARGKITLHEHPDAGLSVSLGGTADEEKARLYEDHLRFLARETHYFRRWYQSVDPAVLMKEILGVFEK